MKRITKTGVFVAAAPLCWLVGLIGVFILFEPWIGGPYVSWSSGVVRAHFLHIGPEADWMIDRLRGESELQWRWNSGGSYRYKTVTVQWRRFPEPGANGTFTVDTASMEYTAGDSSGILTPEVLGDWLTGRSSNREGIAELFQFIRKAGDGNLPPPEHHPHFMDGPLSGSWLHSTTGRRIPVVPVVIWTAIYLLALIFLLKRRHPE